jgi:hypothetical protein
MIYYRYLFVNIFFNGHINVQVGSRSGSVRKIYRSELLHTSQCCVQVW